MAEDNEVRQENKFPSWLTFILVIAAILGALRIATAEYTQVKTLIQNSGPFGMFISVILFGILGATPIPSEPLTILLSTIYGPFLAMIVTSIGNLLSALVEFFIGHGLGNVTNFEEWKSKLPFGLSKFPVDSPIFLTGARMIPGYGSKFVSLVAGFYRVPIWRYIWTTFIATFWGAALTAYGGYHLIRLIAHFLGINIGVSQ
jgi:uncharacterized membrane protein YdjX (TVP38/TMEM64 family)